MAGELSITRWSNLTWTLIVDSLPQYGGHVKLVFFLTPFLAISLGFAQESESALMVNNSSASLDKTQYEVEGQIHTISLAPGVTFGPSINLKTSPYNAFGFRVVAPVTRNDDLQIISMGGFWRHYFSELKTSLFTEAGGGVNFATLGNQQFMARQRSINGTSFISGMANFGILHKINEDVGFGGYGGVDFTNILLTKNDFGLRENTIYLYPRLSMFASIAF